MTDTAADPTRRPRSTKHLSVVARDGAINLVAAIISAGANFALTVVIARHVSPAAAGAFFTVTSLFLMLETLGRLGAVTGLVYFIARWRATGRFERIRSVLRAAYLPVVVVCGLIAIALLIFAPGIAARLGVAHGSGIVLLRVFAVLLPFAAVYDLTIAATRGFGWMQPTVFVDKIGTSVVQLAAVTAVLVAGRGNLLGFAWAVPYPLAFVAGIWMLRRALARYLPAGDSSLRYPQQAMPYGVLVRRFWRFTAPRAVAGLAQVLLQRLDIVLVAAIRGATEAAVYTAATRFLVVGQFINQALTAPVQPQLSACVAAKDVTGARDLYRLSTCWLILSSWPLFGLTAALAPVYVSLFGHRYHSGASIVVILSVAMLIASGVGLVDSVIIMAGKSSWNLWTTLLALVINVGVDLVLIPRFGLVGAAIGWFASIVASNVVPLVVAWRRLELHPFGASTYRALVLCGLCFVAAPAIGQYVFHTVAATSMSVGFGALAYCVGVWRWRSLFHLEALIRRAPRGVTL